MRELERRGHAAVAPGLPCDDPDAGLYAYAEVVSAAIGDAGDVVLVGHSLAGLTVPLVAAARPVRRVVLLAALLPLPGRSLRDQLRDEPDILVPPLGEGLRGDDRRRSVWVDAEVAARTMYSDLPAPFAAAAFARLRPQAAAPERQPHPLDGWPDVATDYVACTADRMVSPEWGRRAARERLGVDARELLAGHAPMLSRPAELADLLVQLR